MSTKEQEYNLNGATVLIVDDEELMREVSEIMITDNGGKVLTAVDGQDAIEVFEKHQESIDLVFIDFSMPRKNGYEAVVAIREMKPEVAVIMVSGLMVSKDVNALIKKGELLFMNKPFHEVELLKSIQKLLKKS